MMSERFKPVVQDLIVKRGILGARRNQAAERVRTKKATDEKEKQLRRCSKAGPIEKK
jgi:hypothetical protein